MAELNNTNFELECETIRLERATYQQKRKSFIPLMVFDRLSAIFLLIGFVALALIPFTEVTLLQATCFFVIYYTLSPTDLDRAQQILKGITEDLAHIRANITVIRKGSEK